MDAPPLCPSQDIVNRNDKSEPIPHLEDSVRIIMDWSEWRDLNSYVKFYHVLNVSLLQ